MADSGLGVFFPLPICCSHKGAIFPCFSMQFLFRYCGPEKIVVTGFFHISYSPSMLTFSVHGSDGLSVHCCNPRIYYYIIIIIIIFVIIIIIIIIMLSLCGTCYKDIDSLYITL